jgi:SAM-dependent methyltransferase
MNAVIDRKLAILEPATLDAAEVSGDLRSHVTWRSYTRLMYPDFDLLNPPHDVPSFDVVFCEQVLEHVADPRVAICTLLDITRPGGTLIVNTPFMIKFHPDPVDYWRFTPDALRQILEEGGFCVEEIGSWGNRTAVISNLFGWTPAYRLLPKNNNMNFPVVVWAFARRPS